VLPRFQSPLREQESWLWCGFAQTAGPTRSGSSKAKASGQGLPFIRALLYLLVCGPQARLRTLPGNDVLGTRGKKMISIKIGRQERGVQVPLHGTDATGALMPALR
jgi:hypothetical protein